MLVVAVCLLGVAGGAVGMLVAERLLAGSRTNASRRAAGLILAEAQRDADATRREQAVKLRADLEAELRERRDEVVKIEERVLAKEDDIDRKLTELTRREQGIA